MQVGVIVLLLLLLLRGPLYRLCINYERIGERPIQSVSDPEFQNVLSTTFSAEAPNLEQILKVSRQLTDRHLSFTTERVGNDAQTVLRTGKANCIGYAALFCSIADELIRQHGLQEQIKITHQVGLLTFFGADIHSIFGDHPFFQDHDFASASDQKSGKTFHIDPTVSDYLGIRFVKSK